VGVLYLRNQVAKLSARALRIGDKTNAESQRKRNVAGDPGQIVKKNRSPRSLALEGLRNRVCPNGNTKFGGKPLGSQTPSTNALAQTSVVPTRKKLIGTQMIGSCLTKKRMSERTKIE